MELLMRLTSHFLDANTSVMLADVWYPTPSLQPSHQFSTHLGANLQTLISSGSLAYVGVTVNNITVYEITKSYSDTGGVADPRALAGLTVISGILVGCVFISIGLIGTIAVLAVSFT